MLQRSTVVFMQYQSQVLFIDKATEDKTKLSFKDRREIVKV